MPVLSSHLDWKHPISKVSDLDNPNLYTFFNPIQEFLKYKAALCVFLLTIVWLFCIPPCDVSMINLPSIFSDNMILQRGQPIVIWGTATPKLPVKIKLGTNEATVVPDITGNWLVKLPPMSAGSNYILSITGLGTIYDTVIHNVAIGDIWLCAGQSNMKMKMKEALHSSADINKANSSTIRFFQIKLNLSDVPQKTVSGSWRPAEPSTVQEFSAVAYYFAHELTQKTKIPIGIIECTSGGTIKDWMSQNSLAGIPRHTKELFTSAVYNGMIAPIKGYGLKGIVWYKGETDAFYTLGYEKLLSILVQDWRKIWNIGTIPFLCVQLPNYPNRCNFTANSAFALIREAQFKCSKTIPNFYLVTTIDTAESTGGLHPKCKREIGHRLAQIAYSNLYSNFFVPTNLTYKSIEFANHKCLLHFAPAQVFAKTENVTGFEVAGKDQIFYPARAQISESNHDIIICSDKVDLPVAVRYAWADNPKCDLYSEARLPISPFRSDSWLPPTLNNAKPASYWLKKAYTAETTAPDIVVLGNDQLLALTGADAYVYHRSIDITGNHRSQVLEHDFYGLLNKKFSVLIGALPKANISDLLIVSRSLFSAHYKPKLVAIGISPKEFIDTSSVCPNNSDVYNFFAKDNALGQELKPVMTDNLSFIDMLKNLLTNWDLAIRQQSNADQFCSLSWENSSQCIYPNGFMIEPTDGFVYRNNLKEYQQRYNKPFSPRLKQQLNCLDGLLNFLRQQHILATVFDLPLTEDNRKLLPTNFAQFYYDQTIAICKKNQADIIMLDADWKAFNSADFIDSAHLNLPGGLKLSRPIALFSANKFKWRTFKQLRQNETKMY